jgi:hypothetical protein
MLLWDIRTRSTLWKWSRQSQPLDNPRHSLKRTTLEPDVPITLAEIGMNPEIPKAFKGYSNTSFKTAEAHTSPILNPYTPTLLDRHEAFGHCSELETLMVQHPTTTAEATNGSPTLSTLTNAPAKTTTHKLKSSSNYLWLVPSNLPLQTNLWKN